MIYNYFPVKMRSLIKQALEVRKDIEEIRVRCGQNVIFSTQRDKFFLNSCGNLTKSDMDAVKLYKEDLTEMLKYFTQNSVYAKQQDIKKGFITLTNGTRVGLCGRCVVKNKEIENINNISSFNIRLSRKVPDWGNETFDKIGVTTKNVLIIAPPGYGKTTLLRNMIKFASDKGKNVSVVDEKSEISPMYEGNSIYDLGTNTDILSDVSKGEGINIVLRTMNPEIIAIDEMLTQDDFNVVKNAFTSGVNIFATFHGRSGDDYLSKIKNFAIDEFLFDSYINISENHKLENYTSCELRRKI